MEEDEIKKELQPQGISCQKNIHTLQSVRINNQRTDGSAEGPPRVVENRNLLSHPDDLRKEAYLIRMT